MLYFDVTSVDNTALPIDETFGIKRIILTGYFNSVDLHWVGVELDLAEDNSSFLVGNPTAIADITFPDTPYGFPAPSCFSVKKIGVDTSIGNGRVFVETSPFVNPNYFEKTED